MVAKASAILISRSGYSERLGGGEVKNNLGFDLSLWRKVNQNLALYIRGEAYLKYLAGVEPLTYNRKNSKYFDYPFAQIAIGFAFVF